MKKLKLNNQWITKDPTTRLYQIPVPIVGLTGGIATGKTTIAEMFRAEGIPVIDADKLVKGIYQKKESFNFISLHFLEAIIDNTIHFKTLRELAFKTPENQTKLENFIYAQMPEAFLEAYKASAKFDFIIYDVPLLFEKGLFLKTDVSVCTYSPRKIQLERLVKRDNISTDLARVILDKQMDIEEKKKRSDLF
ncbi:MAG: dephospho-CoA kinase, partial [Bdellovibrionales bacterium]|nr:dephospho-CoA kinase [Bdellovibrionales bacterium]